jgi:HPt (histidine-containing phosphotransfer) domain-containing protein
VDLLLRTLADIVGELTADAPAAIAVAETQVTAAKRAEMPGLQSTLPIEDPDFLEIVQEFVDRLHDQVGKMQEAFEQKSLDDLANLAHWLKGSGGTAGFPAFTEPAANLEKMAKANRLSDVEAALADVCDLARRVNRPVGTAPATMN